MFHIFFFNSLARSWYLSFFLLSYNFIQWSAGTAKSTIWPVLCLFFFLVIIFSSGRLVENKWFVRISNSQRSLCVLFSWTDSGLSLYHLFVWSNFNFLHSFQWMTLPTQSYLVLYSFYAYLLHSLIMWLIVLSLLPHKLHRLFCCVLSILALTCGPYDIVLSYY